MRRTDYVQDPTEVKKVHAARRVGPAWSIGLVNPQLLFLEPVRLLSLQLYTQRKDKSGLFETNDLFGGNRTRLGDKIMAK
jgi:hypothetical protein